ncbi:hypothetical protein L0Y65_01845 [Candidatus Micrarchaeota archaeon]|nr:hypothetical protein [Candidatus Micrarchaeota archaeon]
MAGEVIAEIEAIKERNARVEADKAWETSITRKAVIAAFTYALSVLILMSIGAPQPLQNALIPAFGFLLSTMTFRILKGYWVRNIYRKRRR